MKAEKPNLSQKIRDLPHKPGVYLYKDRFNRIIYVGKARDLHKRVSQYFHPSRRHTADRKTRALVESIWDLEHHVVKSEPESVLLEGKLIKEYRPRYNISFRDDKRFLLVKVNLNDAFPRFVLTRLKKDDGARYFGPFAHAGALRSTLNMMKKKFRLRTCRPESPGENDFKHCLDHIIRNCSAPCVNKITRAGYIADVQLACDFLEGASGEMTKQIEKDMKAAAARFDFEKAAQLRDMLDDLRRTTAPTKRFARQFETTVRPQQDMEELGVALSMPGPPMIIECFDISNISFTHKVASMVCFTNGKPDKANYRRYRIKSVQGQDDFASMAEVVRRRYARVQTEGIRMPSLVVVDGGKGQLSTARKELIALGLSALPIIGLAKEREEIFFPEQSEPLQLDHSTGALRLLQRVRDEAHRFANGYHQLLMKQRVSESILDDCPGVSENRKKLLLQHFGSIDRLRKASAEDIAKIEGIGVKLAETVANFFEKARRRLPGGEMTFGGAGEASNQLALALEPTESGVAASDSAEVVVELPVSDEERDAEAPAGEEGEGDADELDEPEPPPVPRAPRPPPGADGTFVYHLK